MSFEDIPEDRQESFPCECGGNIVRSEGKWECDSCNAVMGGDSELSD